VEPDRTPSPPEQPSGREREERPVEERVDLDALTEAVARLLRRDLEIARERLGRPRRAL
jgi:hypothetical protein